MKLLIICGPTATGKTNIAFHLASKFNGELISVDSRQVYKGMDIGTGKDKVEGATIWGYDLVDPKEEYSVSDYQKFARDKIQEIWNRNKLPILVGGTGFYIQAVVEGIDTISIPKDEALRKALNNKSVDELVEILKMLDSEKLESLNRSDSANPVRLIRSIEVARSGLKKTKDTSLFADILFIGLEINKSKLNLLIKARVEKRLEQGFEKEIAELNKYGVDWRYQSMNSLGYRQWKDYKLNKISKAEAISNWIQEEQKYAKRQLTWFKKQKNINWFDLSESNIKQRIETFVKTWHNT